MLNIIILSILLSSLGKRSVCILVIFISLNINMYRKILLCFWLTFSFLEAFSQIIIREDTVQCSIYFHQGKSYFDPIYKNNGKRLKEFVNDVYFRSGDPSMSIKRIVVNSGASPEGPTHINDRLSQERADAIISYLKRNSNLDDSMIIVRSPGVDWEGLAQVVVESDKVPDKEAVLEIILSEEFGDDDIARRKELEILNGGKPYRWLYTNLFPLVRHSHASIAYESRFKKEQIIPEGPVIAYRPQLTFNDTSSIMYPTPPQLKDTLTFAIKTNLLYDIMTAVNVEVEVPIGNHWSMAVEYVFPWWETGNKYCLQMLELGVEGRYWFRNNVYHRHKLEGHFIGAYGMSSMFDFQWDYEPAYQGEYWSAGLTYGYSVPLGRSVNMEFSLSVGYLSAAYRHYYPSDDYVLLWRDKYLTGRIGYFGPTKLKVALMVPLHISYNK